MISLSQLPYIVRLLDDESPAVRAAVIDACESLGDTLEPELLRQGLPLTEEQEEPIHSLLVRGRRSRFAGEWSRLSDIEGEKDRLERGMQAVVALQDGPRVAATLPGILDDLAVAYRRDFAVPDPLTLSRFLFKKYGMTGAGSSDYLNPWNSNLAYVIDEKRGLPITLAAVFILVAHRLELSVEGCNLPGHFLAIAPTKDGRLLIDCYNGGRVVDALALARLKSTVSMEDALRMECGSNELLTRVLRNLLFAYKQAGDTESVRLLSRTISIAPFSADATRPA